MSDKSVHHRIDGTLTLIEETNALEEEIMHSTTYLDCFRFSNLRRTEICTMVYLIQVIGGNPLIGYSTFFFEQAGLADAEAFYSKQVGFPHHHTLLTLHQWASATRPWASSAPYSPGHSCLT